MKKVTIEIPDDAHVCVHCGGIVYAEYSHIPHGDLNGVAGTRYCQVIDSGNYTVNWSQISHETNF